MHNAWTSPALDHGKDSYTRVSILGSDNSSPRHICHVNLVSKARRTTLSLQYVEFLLTIFRLLWPSLAACCPTCTGFYGHTNWKFTSLPLHGEEGRSNWERPSQPPAPHGSGMATTCSTLRGGGSFCSVSILMSLHRLGRSHPPQCDHARPTLGALSLHLDSMP